MAGGYTVINQIASYVYYHSLFPNITFLEKPTMFGSIIIIYDPGVSSSGRPHDFSVHQELSSNHSW